MLLAVFILAVVSMTISPAFAHDWDGDGWDEGWGFWTEAVDWDDVECMVEDIDYSGVFEE